MSVYADNSVIGADETAKVATIPDPTVETMGKEFENYGALKALCEQAAEKALPSRVTVVRPGYIVGPDDPSGRFTYWPVRLDRGGEVAVPGSPDDPIQFIDVRDLGAWAGAVGRGGHNWRLPCTRPCKAPEMGRGRGGLQKERQETRQAILDQRRLPC